MKSWKVRLMALLAVAALLLTTGGPVMADDFGDCEFVGFDGDEAIFVCELDVDFDGISDDIDDFIDADFDGFDDRFFFDDDIDEDACIGVEAGSECIGVS